MKKLFFTLLFLFFVYFGIQTIFYFFGPGHAVNYEVDYFKVKEEFANKQNKELQSYNFVVSNNEVEFYLQIFENFENRQKVIKKIKSYKTNNATCILPIFEEDKVLTDLMCLKQGVIYNYADLKNSDAAIDEFYTVIADLIEPEDLSSQDTRSNITLYRNNVQPDYYFSFATYKGYASVSPTKKLLNLKNVFTTDVYNNYLSSYVNEYFVTVNYDEGYEFSKIYFYNYTNHKLETVTLHSKIDKNSYIQGIYESSLYLFDRANKKQYEINVDEKTVVEVGNISIGVKIYRNGNFERESAHNCALKDILFETKKYDGTEKYNLLTTTGGMKTGYTHYYQKNGNDYDIYRVNNAHKNQYFYLFKVKYLEKMIFINEFVYFLDDNYIKYYADATGVRTLVSNKELYFNQNLEYQVIYQN